MQIHAPCLFCFPEYRCIQLCIFLKNALYHASFYMMHLAVHYFDCLLCCFWQYAAIGFALTAKSLARYKRISEDAQFAEYYLIGTLLSNLLVILFYIFIFGKQ